MPEAAEHRRRTARDLLRPEVLVGLKNLQLVAKSVVDGLLVGLHRSSRFGFSQEFAEYKEYVEGDDPRLIDWNVYARSGRTYIKQFFGETNSHLMVFLDASASMGFGSGAVTKFRYGQFLAASLAYLSDRQNDAIGCVVFNDDVQQFVKPSSNSSQLQTLLRVLDEAVVEAGTEFSRPSETFRQVVTKKGIVAVISDFYCDPGPVLEELKAFAWQGQDLILFQILDDDEFQPGFENNVLLRDLETGEAVEVDPSFLKESYPGRLQQHIQNISQNAAAMGAEHVLVKTSDSLDKAMRQYLLTRERRS